ANRSPRSKSRKSWQACCSSALQGDTRQMDERNAERILTAARDVFSTMLDMNIAKRKPYVERHTSPSSEGVVALVGLAGDWMGNASLSCSASFACKIASRMLMMDTHSVDGEVLDAVAEIANMIVGNVKTAVEQDYGPMGMSIPTLIFGRNFSVRISGTQE